MEEKDKEMTLIEHLEELRHRILIIILFFTISSLISYFFSSQLIKFIAMQGPKKLYFIGPIDAFFIKIKITLLSGIVLSFPVIVLQIWKFISPGLKEDERKYLKFFVLPAILLFVSGVAFGIFTVPVAVSFLLKFQTQELQPLLTADKYFSFFINVVLCFGVLFEFPVVVLFLLKTGILTEDILKKYRRYAIVIIFLLCAIITPTQDIITLLIISLPLLLFYEMSIFLSKFVKKDEIKIDKQE